MKIKAGIVGGAGYTAGELLRILLHHPYAELGAIVSSSNAGNAVSSVHDDLVGETDVVFASKLAGDEDVVFLCLGHGNSRAFLEKDFLPHTTHVIDLSNDFRLETDREVAAREFVYGLPELNKSRIQQAQSIANPGCFATAIQLALLPLAAVSKLVDDVHVSAITGSTGAGQSLSDTTHFSWRANNVSIYKAFTHQHLGEIQESLTHLQADFAGDTSRAAFSPACTPRAS
jgi:N-acetyl-gamma-glutamyl-phosphate reductase